MSDIAVVEVGQKPVEKKVEIPKAQPEEKSGKWVRTRFCCCPPTAQTDCRYHSPQEAGWATCPWEQRAGRSEGRWLWSSTGIPLSDVELSIGANIKELSSSQQKAGDRFLG